MKSKTRCEKTIAFNRKELIKKLGIVGKITDIQLIEKIPFLGWTTYNDGIVVTILVSEEKKNEG